MRVVRLISYCFMALWIVFCTCTAMAAPATWPFNHLVFFGDSLSDAGNGLPRALNENYDIGNNAWISSDGKQGAPITNMDSQAKAHLLWVNYLVQDLFPGQRVYPRRLVATLGGDVRNIQAMSYAWASAETGAHYVDDQRVHPGSFPIYNDQACWAAGAGYSSDQRDECVPSVLRQIDFYLKDMHQHPSDKTLFFIWAGGNDVFNNFSKLFWLRRSHPDQYSLPWVLWMLAKSLFQSKITIAPGIELSSPVLNLLQAKEKLMAAGVLPEQLYFIQIPDLSKVPAVIQSARTHPSLLYFFWGFSWLYCIELDLVLALNPYAWGRNLPLSHVYSLNAILRSIYHRGDHHGFVHLRSSCTTQHQQPDCLGFLFFNYKHPSTQFGRFFARSVYESLATSSLAE